MLTCLLFLVESFFVGTMSSEGKTSQTMDNNTSNAILVAIEAINCKLESLDAKVGSLEKANGWKDS